MYFLEYQLHVFYCLNLGIRKNFSIYNVYFRNFCLSMILSFMPGQLTGAGTKPMLGKLYNTVVKYNPMLCTAFYI